MKIATTLNGKHYESPLTREQLIALLDTDKTLDICFQEKQAYDRMACLRGEWEPPLFTACFSICGGHIANYSNDPRRVIIGAHIADGVKFFPTRELAEEFLLIEKGEWLPRKGDEFYTLDGETFKSNDTQYTSPAEFNFISVGDSEFYFPSSAQRQAYIDKNKKPALPTVEELRVHAFSNAPTITCNTELSAYLNACALSRNIASRIRKAERETGNAIKYDYPTLIYRLGYAGEIVDASAAAPGIEYFATKAGAELYRDAMSTDLQHLLTK